MAHKEKWQKRLIFLNFGSNNRKQIKEQSSLFSFEFYRTKGGTKLMFIHLGKAVSFESSRVFTRLHGSDSQFCGIIHEHLERSKINFVDRINLKFDEADHKIAQMPRLAEAGVRIPETFIARYESFNANRSFILSKISFPAVFKTNGSQGRNVYRVNNFSELEKLIDKQKHHGRLFLIQEWVDNKWDVRTLMAFDKHLGSVKRTRKKGFLNNVGSGAKVEKFDADAQMIKVASHACAVNDIDFGGVDFIVTKKGPVILEVNKSPQIKGFEQVYGRGYVWKHIIDSMNNKS
jgi:ribosomal protein S6--L-glutamate ligase